MQDGGLQQQHQGGMEHWVLQGNQGSHPSNDSSNNDNNVWFQQSLDPSHFNPQQQQQLQYHYQTSHPQSGPAFTQEQQYHQYAQSQHYPSTAALSLATPLNMIHSPAAHHPPLHSHSGMGFQSGNAAPSWASSGSMPQFSAGPHVSGSDSSNSNSNASSTDSNVSRFFSTTGSSLATALDFTKSSAPSPQQSVHPMQLQGAPHSAAPTTSKRKSSPTLAAVLGASQAASRSTVPLAIKIDVEDQTDSSEPGTPPPPSDVPTKKAKATPGSILLSRARTMLSAANIDKNAADAARQLIALLSETGEDGKFRRPKSTNAQQRTEILELMGLGGSKLSKPKYYDTWISSPAGRAILGSWLKQAIPPRASSIPDLSTEYQKSLLPLLFLLKNAPVRLAHLQDDVGMGKIVTSVAKRAKSSVAREKAAELKKKWSDLVLASASSSSSSSAATSKAGIAAVLAGNKRPAPSAEAASAAKKLKSVTPSSTGAAQAKGAGVKIGAAPAGAKPAAKAGLSFFALTSVKPAPVKRPVTARPAAAKASSSASNDVMSFIDRIDRPAAAREDAAKAAALKPSAKGKKSVRWKDDSELVMVKLIEVAVYAEDDEEHAALVRKGLGGLEHEEGNALRHAHTEMLEAIDWYDPRDLVVTENPERGCDSTEAKKQAEREQSSLVASYAEGEEPPSADESLATSMPASDLATESKEMTMGPELEPFDYDAADAEPQTAAASMAGGAPSSSGLPISDILAKLVPSNGQSASELLALGNAVALQAAPLSSAAADAPDLKFDMGLLQSILQTAKSNGAAPGGSTASVTSSVHAPAPSATPAPNVSALLASLSAFGTQSNASSTPSYSTSDESLAYGGGERAEPDDGGYWARMYRNQDVPQHQQQQHQQNGYGQTQQPYDYSGQGNYGNGNSSGDGSYGGYPQQQQDHGRYDDGGGGEQDRRTSKIGTVACKWFQQGTCRYGQNCNFRHCE